MVTKFEDFVFKNKSTVSIYQNDENWTKIITTKMKMTKNFKIILKFIIDNYVYVEKYHKF